MFLLSFLFSFIFCDWNLSRRQRITAACIIGLLSFSHLLSPLRLHLSVLVFSVPPFFTLSLLLLRWELHWCLLPFSSDFPASKQYHLFLSLSPLLVFLCCWLVVSLPSDPAVALCPLHTHSSVTLIPVCHLLVTTSSFSLLLCPYFPVILHAIYCISYPLTISLYPPQTCRRLNCKALFSLFIAIFFPLLVLRLFFSFLCFPFTLPSLFQAP